MSESKNTEVAYGRVEDPVRDKEYRVVHDTRALRVAVNSLISLEHRSLPAKTGGRPALHKLGERESEAVDVKLVTHSPGGKSNKTE